MTSLVQSGKYGAINKAYPKTMSYYILKYSSDAFTLQEDIITDRQTCKLVELEVRA